jgi:thymidylate synthase
MKTYRVTRTITIKVYDYIQAESQEEAQNQVDQMKSVLGEISDSGLKDRHIAVAYEDYNEKVEEA